MFQLQRRMFSTVVVNLKSTNCKGKFNTKSFPIYLYQSKEKVETNFISLFSPEEVEQVNSENESNIIIGEINENEYRVGGRKRLLINNPDSFKENEKFLKHLQLVLKEHVETSNLYKNEINEMKYKNSHAPIRDLRSTITKNRIPYPEDIFGYVSTNESCEIVERSYEENQTYRLMTREGLFQLPLDIVEAYKQSCMEKMNET